MYVYVRRYVQSNVEYVEANRGLADGGPEIVKNRPRDLAQHMSEQLLITESLDENGVFLLGSSTFSVVAPFTVIAYRVEFGCSPVEMPSCNCDDWERLLWPCFHFCAVFQRLGRSWKELTEPYRDCPYFLIDEDAVNASVNDINGSMDTSDQMIGCHVEIESGNMTELFDSSHALPAAESHEPYGIRCREVMCRITDLTYACVDTEQLRKLETRLLSIHSELAAAVSSSSPVNGFHDDDFADTPDCDEKPPRRKRKLVAPKAGNEDLATLCAAAGEAEQRDSGDRVLWQTVLF